MLLAKRMSVILFRRRRLHVFGEVARVDDVNLGEGVEEVAGEGVAEAVFEDDESAVAGRGGADDGQTGVAAHEGAVGAGASIAIMLEIDATARTLSPTTR